MQTSKNLIILGPQNSGKTFISNLLIGRDPDDLYVKKECQYLTGPMYQNDQFDLKIIDVPGFFGSYESFDQKQKFTISQESPSLSYLKDVKTLISYHFDKKVDRILVCLDVQSYWDEKPKQMIQIADIMSSTKQQIAFIMTKCNTLLKNQKQTKKNFWRETLEKQGITQIYFFENTLDNNSDFQKFQEDLTNSFSEQIRLWDQLDKQEQQTIIAFFQKSYATCLSLDMQICLDDGSFKKFDEIEEMNNLLSLEKQNKYLGLIHLSKCDVVKFIQFETQKNQVLECTDQHLVYCFSKSDGRPIQDYVKGYQVEIGDYLLYIQQDNQQKKLITSSVQVISIKTLLKQGYWCPLTRTGSIIVNNFLISCYSGVSNIVTQKFAHNCMRPLILYREIFGYDKEIKSHMFSPYARLGNWLFEDKKQAIKKS